MDIDETLRLWAALSPYQQRAKAEADLRGTKQEELESSTAIKMCHPLDEDVSRQEVLKVRG